MEEENMVANTFINFIFPIPNEYRLSELPLFLSVILFSYSLRYFLSIYKTGKSKLYFIPVLQNHFQPLACNILYLKLNRR